MSTPEHSDQPEDQMPSHYEKTHLKGRPFLIGAACFFVFAALLYVLIAVLLQHWSREPWPLRQPPAAPGLDSRWDDRAPQLQVDPAVDLATLRAAENQHLHALHWNDATHAYATIPIEDAMKLVAETAAKNQLNTLLPAPQPATPIQLQEQKSREALPPQEPNP
jgi:hypothetical protein